MFASLKKQPFIKMAQLSTLIAEGVEITAQGTPSFFAMWRSICVPSTSSVVSGYPSC